MTGATDPKCVFCEIIAGTAHAYRIYENELSLAILDINPWAKGHCLVLSKRHVAFWHELNEAETSSLFNAARHVANKIMDRLSPDFVMMYARGRRIPHMHILLVPTYTGDVLDRFFNALEQVQESPQDMAKLKETPSMEEAANLLANS